MGQKLAFDPKSLEELDENMTAAWCELQQMHIGPAPSLASLQAVLAKDIMAVASEGDTDRMSVKDVAIKRVLARIMTEKMQRAALS